MVLAQPSIEQTLPDAKPQELVRSCVRVVKQEVNGLRRHAPSNDFLAIEDPLEITLVHERNGSRFRRVLTLTMRTPGHDPELVVGFLFSEGIIAGANDVTDLQFGPPRTADAAPTRVTVFLRAGLDFEPEKFQRFFAVNSSCGVCGKTSLQSLALPEGLKITDATPVRPGLIHELPDRMRSAQPAFDQSGGLHAAAIFDAKGGLLAVREDIGRHNALDKAIGACLRTGRLPSPGRLLCVSGRMSYEILQKALMARIAVVAGVGAPSSLAVAVAQDFGVTLLGFVRGNRYNIYSGPERLHEP